MAISHPVDSILAADIGSAWTRVVLIDRIEGHYRFVAASDVPTTSAATGATVAAGVRLALREIETGAGRTLLNAAGSLLAPEQPDGSGVDLFVATCSAAPPLQVFVAGLTERASLLGGERAASTTYSRVIGSFALGGKTASTTREPLSALVERLHASLPQAILLTGGTEGGATGPLVRVAEAVALAMAALPAERRPAVVFAGNGAAADSVRAVLAPVAGYLVGENVRPTEEREHTAGAGAVLHELYCERCLNGLPGVDVLRGWAGGPVLAPVEGLSRVARFVAARSGRRALGVDVGATSTALVIASDATIFHTEVRHGLGLGSGLEGVLAQTPPADLLGWVGPGEDGSGPAANQLADALGSYSLRPATRPQSSAALVQLQAAARAALRLAMAEASRSWATARIATGDSLDSPTIGSILLCGTTFREAPEPMQAVLMALDGLRPVGVSHLLRDRLGLVPAIGALAEVAPDVAVALLNEAMLESLGTTVVPAGSARTGERALTLTLAVPDESTRELSVEYGQLRQEPLPPGVTARATVRPSRRFDVGFGPGRAGEITIYGGSAGLVVDARGGSRGSP